MRKGRGKGSPQPCSYLALFSSSAEVAGGPVSRWVRRSPLESPSSAAPSGGPQSQSCAGAWLQKQRLSLRATGGTASSASKERRFLCPMPYSGHVVDPGQQQSDHLWVCFSLLEFSLKCSPGALLVFTFFFLLVYPAFSAHQQPHKVPQEPDACMCLSQLPPDT